MKSNISQRLKEINQIDLSNQQQISNQLSDDENIFENSKQDLQQTNITNKLLKKKLQQDTQYKNDLIKEIENNSRTISYKGSPPPQKNQNFFNYEKSRSLKRDTEKNSIKSSNQSPKKQIHFLQKTEAQKLVQAQQNNRKRMKEFEENHLVFDIYQEQVNQFDEKKYWFRKELDSIVKQNYYKEQEIKRLNAQLDSFLYYEYIQKEVPTTEKNWEFQNKNNLRANMDEQIMQLVNKPYEELQQIYQEKQEIMQNSKEEVLESQFYQQTLQMMYGKILDKVQQKQQQVKDIEYLITKTNINLNQFKEELKVEESKYNYTIFYQQGVIEQMNKIQEIHNNARSKKHDQATQGQKHLFTALNDYQDVKDCLILAQNELQKTKEQLKQLEIEEKNKRVLKSETDCLIWDLNIFNYINKVFIISDPDIYFQNKIKIDFDSKQLISDSEDSFFEEEDDLYDDDEEEEFFNNNNNNAKDGIQSNQNIKINSQRIMSSTSIRNDDQQSKSQIKRSVLNQLKEGPEKEELQFSNQQLMNKENQRTMLRIQVNEYENDNTTTHKKQQIIQQKRKIVLHTKNIDEKNDQKQSESSKQKSQQLKIKNKQTLTLKKKEQQNNNKNTIHQINTKTQQMLTQKYQNQDDSIENTTKDKKYIINKINKFYKKANYDIKGLFEQFLQSHNYMNRLGDNLRQQIMQLEIEKSKLIEQIKQYDLELEIGEEPEDYTIFLNEMDIINEIDNKTINQLQYKVQDIEQHKMQNDETNRDKVEMEQNILKYNLFVIRILGKFGSLLNTVQSQTSKFPHLKKLLLQAKQKIEELGSLQGQLEKKELSHLYTEVEKINIDNLKNTKANTVDKICKIILEEDNILMGIKQLFLQIFPNFNTAANIFIGTITNDQICKSFTQKQKIIIFLIKLRREYDKQARIYQKYNQNCMKQISQIFDENYAIFLIYIHVREYLYKEPREIINNISQQFFQQISILLTNVIQCSLECKQNVLFDHKNYQKDQNFNYDTDVYKKSNKRIVKKLEEIHFEQRGVSYQCYDLDVKKELVKNYGQPQFMKLIKDETNNKQNLIDPYDELLELENQRKQLKQDYEKQLQMQQKKIQEEKNQKLKIFKRDSYGIQEEIHQNQTQNNITQHELQNNSIYNKNDQMLNNLTHNNRTISYIKTGNIPRKSFQGSHSPLRQTNIEDSLIDTQNNKNRFRSQSKSPTLKTKNKIQKNVVSKYMQDTTSSKKNYQQETSKLVHYDERFRNIKKEARTQYKQNIIQEKQNKQNEQFQGKSNQKIVSTLFQMKQEEKQYIAQKQENDKQVQKYLDMNSQKILRDFESQFDGTRDQQNKSLIYQVQKNQRNAQSTERNTLLNLTQKNKKKNTTNDLNSSLDHLQLEDEQNNQGEVKKYTFNFLEADKNQKKVNKMPGVMNKLKQLNQITKSLSPRPQSANNNNKYSQIQSKTRYSKYPKNNNFVKNQKSPKSQNNSNKTGITDYKDYYDYPNTNQQSINQTRLLSSILGSTKNNSQVSKNTLKKQQENERNFHNIWVKYLTQKEATGDEIQDDSREIKKLKQNNQYSPLQTHNKQKKDNLTQIENNANFNQEDEKDKGLLQKIIVKDFVKKQIQQQKSQVVLQSSQIKKQNTQNSIPLEQHLSTVTCMIYNSQNDKIYTANNKGEIIIWKNNGNKEINQYYMKITTKINYPIYSLKIWNNKIIMAGDYRVSIQIWNQKDPKKEGEISHKFQVDKMLILQNNKLLVMGNNNDSIIIYDLLTFRKLKYFECGSNLQDIIIDINHKSQFYSLSQDNKIRLWDIGRLNKQANILTYTHENLKNSTYIAQYQNSTEYIISVSDNFINLWSFKGEQYNPQTDEYRLKFLKRLTMESQVLKIKVVNELYFLVLEQNGNISFYKNISFKFIVKIQNQNAFDALITSSVVYSINTKKNMEYFEFQKIDYNKKQELHNQQEYMQQQNRTIELSKYGFEAFKISELDFLTIKVDMNLSHQEKNSRFTSKHDSPEKNEQAFNKMYDFIQENDKKDQNYNQNQNQGKEQNNYIINVQEITTDTNTKQRFQKIQNQNDETGTNNTNNKQKLNNYQNGELINPETTQKDNLNMQEINQRHTKKQKTMKAQQIIEKDDEKFKQSSQLLDSQIEEEEKIYLNNLTDNQEDNMSQDNEENQNSQKIQSQELKDYEKEQVVIKNALNNNNLDEIQQNTLSSEQKVQNQEYNSEISMRQNENSQNQQKMVEIESQSQNLTQQEKKSVEIEDNYQYQQNQFEKEKSDYEDEEFQDEEQITQNGNKIVYDDNGNDDDGLVDEDEIEID